MRGKGKVFRAYWKHSQTQRTEIWSLRARSLDEAVRMVESVVPAKCRPVEIEDEMAVERMVVK